MKHLQTMSQAIAAILSELHRLPAGRVHRRAILALVGFYPDVRLPLALEDKFLKAVVCGQNLSVFQGAIRHCTSWLSNPTMPEMPPTDPHVGKWTHL